VLAFGYIKSVLNQSPAKQKLGQFFTALCFKNQKTKPKQKNQKNQKAQKKPQKNRKTKKQKKPIYPRGGGNPKTLSFDL